MSDLRKQLDDLVGRCGDNARAALQTQDKDAARAHLDRAKAIVTEIKQIAYDRLRENDTEGAELAREAEAQIQTELIALSKETQDK